MQWPLKIDGDFKLFFKKCTIATMRHSIVYVELWSGSFAWYLRRWRRVGAFYPERKKKASAWVTSGQKSFRANFIIQGERVRNVYWLLFAAKANIGRHDRVERKKTRLGHCSLHFRVVTCADFGLHSHCACLPQLSYSNGTRLVIIIYTLFPEYPRYRPGATN